MYKKILLVTVISILAIDVLASAKQAEDAKALLQQFNDIKGSDRRALEAKGELFEKLRALYSGSLRTHEGDVSIQAAVKDSFVRTTSSYAKALKDYAFNGKDREWAKSRLAIMRIKLESLHIDLSEIDGYIHTINAAIAFDRPLPVSGSYVRGPSSGPIAAPAVGAVGSVARSNASEIRWGPSNSVRAAAAASSAGAARALTGASLDEDPGPVQ